MRKEVGTSVEDCDHTGVSAEGTSGRQHWMPRNVRYHVIVRTLQLFVTYVREFVEELVGKFVEDLVRELSDIVGGLLVVGFK